MLKVGADQSGAIARGKRSPSPAFPDMWSAMERKVLSRIGADL
jgi:hypothetical protein